MIAVIAIVKTDGKPRCRYTFDMNVDRIAHFKRRSTELGKTPDEVVIVILNVDDDHGGPLAEVLMPNTNWQEFRDRGEVPFARGLANRKGIQGALWHIDREAAEKLMLMDELAVIVVDHGTADVFPA